MSPHSLSDETLMKAHGHGRWLFLQSSSLRSYTLHPHRNKPYPANLNFYCILNSFLSKNMEKQIGMAIPIPKQVSYGMASVSLLIR